MLTKRESYQFICDEEKIDEDTDKQKIRRKNPTTRKGKILYTYIDAREREKEK